MRDPRLGQNVHERIGSGQTLQFLAQRLGRQCAFTQRLAFRDVHDAEQQDVRLPALRDRARQRQERLASAASHTGSKIWFTWFST